MVKRHTRTRKQKGGTPALSSFESDLDMFASELKELWHKAGGSRKSRRHPRKGRKSRTHKGRRDFTTKKGNKKFNRKGHRQSRAQGSKKHRRPYSKRGGWSYARSHDGSAASFGGRRPVDLAWSTGVVPSPAQNQ